MSSREKSWLPRLTAVTNISKDQARHLLSSYPHSPYIHRHRAEHIIGRVQLVSAIFAVPTLLWIIVDYLVFPWPLWGAIAGVRVAAAAVFILLAWPRELDKTYRVAMIMLAGMMLVPVAFYLFTLQIFYNAGSMHLLGDINIALYALLPLVVVAGLSLFPLTLVELAIFGLPIIALSAYGVTQIGEFTWVNFVGDVWLSILIFGAAGFSSSSHLRYMIILVSQSSLDPLTGVYTRRSGGEIVDLQFRVAVRQDIPFAMVFVDLDDFKSVNDNFGHDEGDRTLVNLTTRLKSYLRASDAIARWGGEEFLIILPNTDIAGAKLVIQRMMKEWFGKRPDGATLTASFGIAERKADQLGDWPQLVELADSRMYAAKKAGKHRAVFNDEEIMVGSSPL